MKKATFKGWGLDQAFGLKQIWQSDLLDQWENNFSEINDIEKSILLNLQRPLNRVGSSLGVDLEKLQSFQRKAKNHTLVASGGIRDKTDLLALKNIGIDYALCASALHTGKITAADL